MNNNGCQLQWIPVLMDTTLPNGYQWACLNGHKKLIDWNKMVVYFEVHQWLPAWTWIPMTISSDGHQLLPTLTDTSSCQFWWISMAANFDGYQWQCQTAITAIYDSHQLMSVWRGTDVCLLWRIPMSDSLDGYRWLPVLMDTNGCLSFDKHQ